MKRSTHEIIHPFQRLQTMLASLISETPPGNRLPSEPELAHQLGVSRATLREAMRTFEGQGLIRRRQGVGTFVVSHSQIIDSGLEVLESIETLAKKIGLDVSMGAFQVTQIEADEQLADALDVAPRTTLVKVARVINAEDRPVAFLVDILPTDILLPSDLQTGFTGSVLDLLMRRGSPELANSLTEICSVPATSEIARALEIQRGDTLLMFTARLYSNLGRVVDYSYSYFLPGYFRFHVVRKVGVLMAQP
ncbi:MAG: GntR family transcriptional regulator [Anaerolineaceae bacterium]|jgi:GntR family transcriptional regulator